MTLQNSGLVIDRVDFTNTNKYQQLPGDIHMPTTLHRYTHKYTHPAQWLPAVSYILILVWGVALLMALSSMQSVQASTCRDPAVKHKFDVINGYPHGRPGYIVDHKCSLFCSGIDNITNMQYQTVSDSKAKDKWENTKAGCKSQCTPENSTPTRQVFNCR